MRPIIIKCVERHTEDTVNGPLTKVKLVPAGNGTDDGSITMFLHDAEDLDTYQVGRRFRLKPERIDLGKAGTP